MKILPKLRAIAGGFSLAALLLVSTAGGAFAAPGQASQSQKPPRSTASGAQAKPQLQPGKEAKQSTRLGDTKYAKTNAAGAPEDTVRALAGNVANVDLQPTYNYCWKNFIYTPVKNATAATKYVQVRVYNQGTYHDQYLTVGANTTIYPGYYGIQGSYYVDLYVWNGSYYQYDEYKSSNNTCNVSVTRTYNSGGWVQLKIQNLGTAYATQRSVELAPFPASGTYTGTQYDYPVAGGAAIYRWFWVSTSPYGIVSETMNSTNSPYFFTGDL